MIRGTIYKTKVNNLLGRIAFYERHFGNFI